MIKNKKEIILYLFFGVATTLVNLMIFVVFELLLGKDLYLVSNVIAWIGAVIFAFFVNKFFVFESNERDRKRLFLEISEFVGARLLSLFVEEAGLFLLVTVLSFKHISLNLIFFTLSGQLISKILLAIIVVILNYFFSKYIIFKKKKNK